MKLFFTILLSVISIFSFGQTPTRIDLNRAIFIKESNDGRPKAVRERGQDTLITPNSCGVWFNQFEDSVYCFNVLNNYLVGGGGAHIRYPVEFSIDTRAHFIPTRIGVCFGYNTVGSVGGHMKIMMGTPYKWEDTIAIFTDNGSLDTVHWLKFSPPNHGIQRFFHIEFDSLFPSLSALVFYGITIDTIAPDFQPAPLATNNMKKFGVNGIFHMGDGKFSPSGPRINNMELFTGSRMYEWANFALINYQDTTQPEVLVNSGQGLNFDQSQQSDTLHIAGNDMYVVHSEMTLPVMYQPRLRAASLNYGLQKGIDYTLNKAGDTTADGYPRFVWGRVGEKPASYAHIAYFAKLYAAAIGSRTYPFHYYEPGNEFDGSFIYDAKRYDPNQLAAYMSALYDGHENTLTWNGQSVGIHNSGTSVKMVMPAINIYNYDYLQAMEFWFYWNRTDHKFAADIGNVHSYPNTLDYQGAAGKGVPPENPRFNLSGKMQQLKLFFDRHAIPAWNTEIGYDNFDSVTTSPFCIAPACTFGGSFMNPPSTPGQSIEETNGNMVARTMLIMSGANVPYFNYWLADQYNKAGHTLSGTFNSSGLLAIDTQIAFIPIFLKRPAYYYFLTIDSALKGYDFVSDTLVLQGSDSVRVQKYQNSAHSYLTKYVLWSPTVKNASFTYNLPLGTIALTQQLNLTIGYDYGVLGGISSLVNNVTLPVNETPVILTVNTNASIIRRILKGEYEN